MRLTSLLGPAAAALTVDAFLVPAEVSPDAVIKSGAPDLASTFSTSKQVVDLECQDCQAAVGKHGVVGYRAVRPETGTKMSVEMKFEVRNGVLTLNDAPVYPPPAPRSVPIIYTARQIVSGPSNDFYRGRLPLSVSVEIQQTDAIKGSDGTLKVHPISVEAIGLGQFPVHVPTVHVRLAELENGEFKLLPLSTTRYKHNPAADACHSIMCRARTILATKLAALRAAAIAKLGALRGCHRKIFGALGAHRGPVRVGGGSERPAHRFAHHGQRHGGFRTVTARMMNHVLLPILLGICTGAFLGAVAMLAFTAVRAVVRRVRGERRAAYLPVGADEAEEGRVSADGPPKYEDVYVEGEEDEADEKKGLLPGQQK